MSLFRQRSCWCRQPAPLTFSEVRAQPRETAPTLHADLPVVLGRMGYPYALNKKRCPDETGIVTQCWATDSFQAYLTALYKAAVTSASSHSGLRTFASRLLPRGADIEKDQLPLAQ